MSDEMLSQPPAPDETAIATRNERAKYFGYVVGLLIAGSGMLAKLWDWTKTDADLFLPAIFIGVAVNYLYRAIGR